MWIAGFLGLDIHIIFPIEMNDQMIQLMKYRLARTESNYVPSHTCHWKVHLSKNNLRRVNYSLYQLWGLSSSWQHFWVYKYYCAVIIIIFCSFMVLCHGKHLYCAVIWRQEAHTKILACFVSVQPQLLAAAGGRCFTNQSQQCIGFLLQVMNTPCDSPTFYTASQTKLHTSCGPQTW